MSIPRAKAETAPSIYLGDMRNSFFPILLAAWLLSLGAYAQPGSLQGTVNQPGDIEVVSRDGYQYVKFGESFSVESQAECEVRHLDAQTGQVTTIGQLVSKHGYQVYQVPDGLVIDDADRIVIYSPLIAEDLASVELR